MKKYLFLASVAALSFTACTNETEEYVGTGSANQQQEIAFVAVSQPTTRGQYAVTTTTFPTDNTMEVRAYKTQPTPGDYFDQTTFTKGEGATWKGSKYWPLGVSKLNFFAVSGFGVDEDDIEISDALAGATVAYTTANSYSATTQSDIMYAFGRGAVTKSGSSLVFPTVAMEFKHALALVDFEVKGYSATEVAAITVNSITLKGAKYNGTLTLTNTNAATESDAVTTAVSWVAGDAVATQTVPGVSASTAITTDFARIGKGLMVIPGTGFTSFVINYTMDGDDYDYEYTPDPAVSSTTANNKYTYQITFKLHEIEIAPTVAEWTNTNTGVTIQN